MRFQIMLTMLVSSCSQEGVFDSGENEVKPAASAPIYIPDSNEKAERQLIFHGYYDVEVSRKNDGVVVCSGSAEIITYSDLTVVKGKVPCQQEFFTKNFVKEVEIGDGIERPATQLPPDQVLALGLDSRVKHITRKGTTTFSPHRPDIVGPIIQDPASYADLDIVTDYSVRYETGILSKPIENASGSTHVKVLEVDTTYRPTPQMETYDRVIHYQINSKGFDGLSDKGKVGIYQTYEYRWNTQPMHLLNVHIEGPVQDFEANGFRGFAGNIIFGGGIVIDMKLRELAQPE